MPTVEETVNFVLAADTMDERVNRIRLVPQHHGTGDHATIYAALAREAYVQHLAPDFAYVHQNDFYDLPYFSEVYEVADTATNGFIDISVDDLIRVLLADSRTLLVFRTVLGLTKDEFAHSTKILADRDGLSSISGGRVDGMERKGSAVSKSQATVVARTISEVLVGSLFGDPPGSVRRKQDKPDTVEGWKTVATLAREGVPYSYLLHQRHYGGAFRQLLDATSTRRGDVIEDAVETLFSENGIPYVRTGSHNQSDIETRFGVRVTPAPDFVVYNNSGALRAMLECKGANDGGTARDKALRFKKLHDESIRLGGIPLLAVLGGIGWSRVNDTLGPVVGDTDGRVFTLKNLPSMLQVQPFPALLDTAE